MKGRYKRESRRLFLILLSVIILLTFVSVFFYGCITYENTKSNLIDKAKLNLTETINRLHSEIRKGVHEDEFFTWFVSSCNNPNVYMEISYDFGQQVKTQNALATKFYGKCILDNFDDGEQFYEDRYYIAEKHNQNSYTIIDTEHAYIDYDTFRKSMTNKQYKTIANYLQSESVGDKKQRYELVCTEYYGSGKTYEVKPLCVEVVLTSDDNVWYVQDTVVRKFKLAPKGTDDMNLYQITDTRRNVIDTDFVLNRIGKSDFKSKDLIRYNNINITNTGNGEFIIAGKAFLNYDSYFNRTNRFNRISGASMVYLERVNAFEGCIDNIITVSVFIILFFAILGGMLEFLVIHTFNSRVRQEQKRLEMTNAFAHNMKTPLQVIIGYSENLSRHIEIDSNKRYADVIRKQSFEMDSLVKRMLDFSRLDSGEIKISKSSFILDDLLCEVLEKYESLSDKEIKVESDNVEIIADRELLKLAIENLVENAIKYSGSSEINILIKNNCFKISNCCKGITDRDIKKLWQPYFRKNNNSEKGNGIGLSIVKSVLDLHKFKYGTRLNDSTITFWFRYI